MKTAFTKYDPPYGKSLLAISSILLIISTLINIVFIFAALVSIPFSGGVLMDTFESSGFLAFFLFPIWLLVFLLWAAVSSVLHLFSLWLSAAPFSLLAAYADFEIGTPAPSLPMIAVISFTCSILPILAGFLGIRFSSKPEKSKDLKIVTIAIGLPMIIISMFTAPPLVGIIRIILLALFFVGAVKNDKFHKEKRADAP